MVAGEGRVDSPATGIARGRRTTTSWPRSTPARWRVVLPSWLEGFGLPPLEAAARGTPAIVRPAVYAETLGDGALRVPPGDEGALADALLRSRATRRCARAWAPPRASAAAPLTWARAAARAARAAGRGGAR